MHSLGPCLSLPCMQWSPCTHSSSSSSGAPRPGAQGPVPGNGLARALLHSLLLGAWLPSRGAGHMLQEHASAESPGGPAGPLLGLPGGKAQALPGLTGTTASRAAPLLTPAPALGRGAETGTSETQLSSLIVPGSHGDVLIPGASASTTAATLYPCQHPPRELLNLK